MSPAFLPEDLPFHLGQQTYLHASASAVRTLLDSTRLAPDPLAAVADDILLESKLAHGSVVHILKRDGQLVDQVLCPAWTPLPAETRPEKRAMKYFRKSRLHLSTIPRVSIFNLYLPRPKGSPPPPPKNMSKMSMGFIPPPPPEPPSLIPCSPAWSYSFLFSGFDKTCAESLVLYKFLPILQMLDVFVSYVEITTGIKLKERALTS